MSGTTLTFCRLLDAPPPRAFAAVTEARHLERWFCDACESDPRPGGALVMRWTRRAGTGEPFVARWLRLAAPGHASFRGGHEGYPGGDAGEVEFTIAEEGEGSRVDIRHVVPAGDDYAPLLAEWQAAWPRALDRLERHLLLEG